MPNYRKYVPSKKERLLNWSYGFIVAFLAIFLLFNFFWLAVAAGIYGAHCWVKLHINKQINERKKYLQLQFADLLVSLTNSYSIGQNTINAFTLAHDDLARQYGETALIVAEVKHILISYKNNIPLETSIDNFANRSNVSEIINFSEVFLICSKVGGNLRELVTEIRDLIRYKITIEMTIETTMIEKKNEFKLMLMLPFLILFMLSLLGREQFFLLSIPNIIAKLIAIFLFIIAYFIGKKITTINV